MSDDELQAGVIDELRFEPAARKSRILVRARDGTVTLSGQVASFAEKQRIDGAIARVAGIKALDTQICIKRFAMASVTDQ